MDGHGNKQEMAHSIRNPFQKEVEKIATSFFVTNFPEYIDAKGLWKVCESYGRILLISDQKQAKGLDL